VLVTPTPLLSFLQILPDYFLKPEEFISLFIVCGYFFLTFGSLSVCVDGVIEKLKV